MLIMHALSVSQTNNQKKISLFLALFIVSTIFIPEIIDFCLSASSGKLFTYVNAWDEETYLSYQGALGARNIPGYFGLYIVTFLHELGIPGAIQHLIFDVVLIPLTIYFITKTCLFYLADKKQAFFYAIIILFSSVLLNNSDPIINFIYSSEIKTIVTGSESYPSFIRIPNPLFSYFLISLCVYVSLRMRKNWLLILPLFGLYYFVFQPYLFCLIIIFLAKRFNGERATFDIILYNLLAYFIIAILAYFAFRHLLPQNFQTQVQLLNSQHLIVGRTWVLPLYTIFSLGLFLIAYMIRTIKPNTIIFNIFISLVLCTFLISNIQIITNLLIDIKNFQDYGNSLMWGLIIVVFLESLEAKFALTKIKSKSTLGVLALIAICSLYNFLPKLIITLIYNETSLNKNEITSIIKKPLQSIVLNPNSASKISYSQAKMPALLGSYSITFPFIYQQCSCYIDLTEHALSFLAKNGKSNENLNTLADNLQITVSVFKNNEYCKTICLKNANKEYKLYFDNTHMINKLNFAICKTLIYSFIS